MTINGILVALIAQLKTNLNPSIGAMVINKNQVYEGVRENVITFPCIIVELGRNNVDDYSYPYEKIRKYFKSSENLISDPVERKYLRSSSKDILFLLKEMLEWRMPLLKSIARSSADGK